MTFGPASEMFPVWTPDGKWLFFGSSRAREAASTGSERICRVTLSS